MNYISRKGQLESQHLSVKNVAPLTEWLGRMRQVALYAYTQYVADWNIAKVFRGITKQLFERKAD